jgi:hypothetical protein
MGIRFLFQPWARIFVFTCLGFAVLLGSSCRSGSGPSASNQHFKAGLRALDRGDYDSAERELKSSLDANPGNNKARTALASVYAQKAGISWSLLFDLLMEAGRELDSKMRTYRSSLDMQNLISGVNSDMQEENGEARGGSRRDVELKKRVVEIYSKVGMVAVGAIIAIDLIHGIPYMTPAQLGYLDQAIQVLRNDNSSSVLRHEDVKVYLSVLGIVRFIFFTRQFLGTFDHEAAKLFTNKSRFCKADATDARYHLTNIHDSLLTVAEGLSISEEEANTPPRKSRLKLHRFVQKFLMGKIWEDLDKFFLPDSDEHRVAMRYFTRVCGIGPRPVPDQPESVPDTGAHLFDPDS